MLNDDVTDLYQRVNVGAKVVVLPMQSGRRQGTASNDRSALGAPLSASADIGRGHRLY